MDGAAQVVVFVLGHVRHLVGGGGGPKGGERVVIVLQIPSDDDAPRLSK